jgi:pimeloyl-ACP methyl ester carboxylesterase
MPLHLTDRGHGPALILLHGFPLDLRMWSAQLDALSAKHRVLAPDFPGFGKSQPSAPFTMESLADAVHAMAVEDLGSDPHFVLAGLSMGGYVSLAYARKYAKTLRGLILVDTKSDNDTPEAREGRDKMITTVREKGAVAIGDAMQPKLLAPDTDKARPQLVKRLREMTDSQSPLTIEHALTAMKSRENQTPHLPSIQTPTLIIVGDVDAITPPAVAEQMQKAIPNAELAIIRGAGHMSPMEQPEQVNAAMGRFLAHL